MSFEIEFSGTSSGCNYHERRSYGSKGFSFPTARVDEALMAIATDSARTAVGDPTSTVSGGATISLTAGAGAMQVTHALRSLLTTRLMQGNGSLLVTAWNKRWWWADGADQKRIQLHRTSLTQDISDFVAFLEENDLAASMPYYAFMRAFEGFTQRCRGGGRFSLRVEYWQ